MRSASKALLLAVALLFSSAAPAALASTSISISYFAPDAGPVGSFVEIYGDNLGKVTAASFNGVPSTDIRKVSNYDPESGVVFTTLFVKVPGGATTGAIRVSGSGMSATAGPFTVTVPPRIDDFTPKSGPVATDVTIRGDGLDLLESVSFNGRPAKVRNVTATSLIATVPAGATTGAITVYTAGGSARTATSFTVTAKPPEVTGIMPAAGTPGTIVTVAGRDLGQVKSVTFGGTPATEFHQTAVGLEVTVPEDAQSGRVGVTILDAMGATQSAQSPANFAVDLAARKRPKIFDFEPKKGPTGTRVLITGKNFTDADGRPRIVFVIFDRTEAQFNVLSDTQLEAFAPACVRGKIAVSEEGAHDFVNSEARFTVIPSPGQEPVVTDIIPKRQSIGGEVRIFGRNFALCTLNDLADFDVNINGMGLELATIFSDREIFGIIGIGTKSGPVTVTNRAGSGTSAATLEVIPTPELIAPEIIRFSPTAAPTGSTITIEGVGFTDRDDFPTTVRIGGVDAPVKLFQDLPMRLEVEANGASGFITVTNPLGTATSSEPFFDLKDGPVVTGLAPRDGPAGSLVTVFGRNLQATRIALFRGVGNADLVPSPRVEPDPDGTRVVIEVPATARPDTTDVINLFTKELDFRVPTPLFTVVGTPPEVTGLSPTSGKEGDRIRIFVKSVQPVFLDSRAVQFSGPAGSRVAAQVVGNTVLGERPGIDVLVPRGAVTGPIVVSNSAGASQSEVFTIIANRSFNGFLPARGGAGTLVHVIGEGLENVDRAFIGAKPCPVVFVDPNGREVRFTVATGAMTGRITVGSAGFSISSAADFIVEGTAVTVVPPDTTSPLITGFTPASGAAGTRVTIAGARLTSVAAVRFNGVPGTSVAPNAAGTSVAVTVPALATTGAITIVTAAGTATSPIAFNVSATADPTTVSLAPVIESVMPPAGGPGSWVSITGNNLDRVTSVTFNGVPAAIGGVSRTVLNTTVPEGATSGSIMLSGAQGSAASATFRVPSSEPPVFTSFSPDSGRPGSTITILGRNLVNIRTVQLNDAILPWTVSADGTQITATVLEGAASGKVSVTTRLGTVMSSSEFTVIP